MIIKGCEKTGGKRWDSQSPTGFGWFESLIWPQHNRHTGCTKQTASVPVMHWACSVRRGGDRPIIRCHWRPSAWQLATAETVLTADSDQPLRNIPRTRCTSKCSRDKRQKANCTLVVSSGCKVTIKRVHPKRISGVSKTAKHVHACLDWVVKININIEVIFKESPVMLWAVQSDGSK